MEHIGFVGVGRMGANMARRLHDQGHRINAVQDRDPPVAQALARELGCEVAPMPARVAEVSQVIVTVVSDDAAMRAIYGKETPSSLLAFAKHRLFINCATITPSVHVEVEEAVERQGGACLEACMASSITQARQGTLYLMCGGKPDAFARAKPLLEALGSTIRYIGGAGEAAKVKALVNMVMNCNTAALAEGWGLEGLRSAWTLRCCAKCSVKPALHARVGNRRRGHAGSCPRMLFLGGPCCEGFGHCSRAGQVRWIDLAFGARHLRTISTARRLGRGDLDKSGVAELTFKGRQE